MKGQLPARTPAHYIAQLEEPRRTDIARLDRLIRNTVPELKPCIVEGTLAYGPVHYKYASGREGDAARIAVASNAAAISLYIMAVDEEGWVLARYASRLGKATVGKSCIRFKRLDDLDQDVLRALLRHAAAASFPAHGGSVTEQSVPSRRRRTAR